MLDKTPVEWTFDSNWLHSTFNFKSYSDASLAELCFDDELPLPLLQKVFQVILDPDFKLQDVTFKSVWDICQYLSDCRKENVRTRSVAVNSSAANEYTSVTTRPGVVPPVVLEFVVDQVLDERGSLTDAASWVMGSPNAFCRNGGDFRNMSLVHRSWTPIAQRGLRKRVMVRWKNIKNFLFNPFCGPQVTEMVIDWKFEDGRSFPTKNDIQLLDELLLRTPNLRSLAFNTSASKSRRHFRVRNPYSLEIEACMEIIAERLPYLENLWLAHYCNDNYDPYDVRGGSTYEYYHCCPGLAALYTQFPKLLLLKFLSVRGWGLVWGRGAVQEWGRGELRGWGGVSNVDWNAHPPAQLQTIELDYYQDIDEHSLNWLLEPRGGYNLESLSISICKREYHSETMILPRHWRSGIKRLALYVAVKGASTPVHQWIQYLLDGCEELVSLDLCVERGYDFVESIILPASLERLSVHYYDGTISNHFPKSSELTPAGRMLVSLVQRNLPRLPRLRTLLVTARNRRYERGITGRGEINENFEPEELVQDGLPKQLLDICRDHGVEVNH